jgi:hypothetical protein
MPQSEITAGTKAFPVNQAAKMKPDVAENFESRSQCVLRSPGQYHVARKPTGNQVEASVVSRGRNPGDKGTTSAPRRRRGNPLAQGWAIRETVMPTTGQAMARNSVGNPRNLRGRATHQKGQFRCFHARDSCIASNRRKAKSRI